MSGHIRIAGAFFFGLLFAGVVFPAHSQDHGTHAQQAQEISGTQSTHVHHRHSEGMWMFEYRFMRMAMRDLIAGSTTVAAEQALNNSQYLNPSGQTYTMLPTEMTMDMHMLMAMYSFTERLSAMVMLNYLDNDMDMIMDMGMMTSNMSMSSSGLGDTEVGLMYDIDAQSPWNVVAALVLSLPTGSIDEKGDVMGGEAVLPYAMQLGSGTFDLKPSLSASTRRGNFEWGAQGIYTLRLGDNDQDYNFGDELELVGYGKYTLSSGVTFHGAVTYTDSKGVEGVDKRLTNLRSSPNVAANYGGTRIDGALGVLFASGSHMIGAEYAVPVHQNRDGLQMEAESTFSLTYSYMVM